MLSVTSAATIEAVEADVQTGWIVLGINQRLYLGV
jgi:hypothetical protein